MTKRDEEQIARIMQGLKCGRDEALEIFKADQMIDHGDKELFALSDEQKKVEKAMRQAARTPTAYKFTKRERKADDVKAEIINCLRLAVLANLAEEVNVTNPERQFNFEKDGEVYEITLIKKRKEKK